MRAAGRAQSRLSELITCAEAFRAYPDGPTAGVSTIPTEELWRFIVSSLQTVLKVCGERSPHYQELVMIRDHFRTGEPLQLHVLIGILEAAADDLKAGLLSDLGELMAAEVFDDLLETASHLHESGYHLPAAALAGAVLEDTLRKVCGRHGITWSGDSSISKLNTELYKANLYSKPTHGQIETWGKLRNQVDHHNFTNPEDIDARDVQRMISGIRDFLATNLA